VSDEAFDVLCRCARLNAAVARARRALVSARAGVSLAKRDLREKRTTPAKLAEEAIREAAAEDALRDAVAAWARDGHRLRDELREARRGRMRVTIGDNFDAAVAALTARFGEPDPESRTRTKHGRGAYWTRDIWNDARWRSRIASRSFGVCEDCVESTRDRLAARVRIFGEAAGSGHTLVGGAEVNVLVGVEPYLADAIHHASLPRGAEYAFADPGPYGSRDPGADRDHWIPWAFDAPGSAEALLLSRSSGYGPPHLAPLPLAVEAVALMLAAPRPAAEIESA